MFVDEENAKYLLKKSENKDEFYSFQVYGTLNLLLNLEKKKTPHTW